MLPEKLKKKLKDRKESNALRNLGTSNMLVDFSSNDYLGFSYSEDIFNKTHEFLVGHNIKRNGATGSRLLTGNHALFSLVEDMLCGFHNSEAAIVFNSGYDANLGFFSSVPQRGDIILYDEYIHASIRDGISLSHAKAYKFKHNDLEALEKLMLCHSKLISESHQNIYIVTESVFSMDGDTPNLFEMSTLCKKYSALLVIDEAHAVGVIGKRGEGIIQNLNLENEVFARIVTFGKALGGHGAAILGSNELRHYLLNFSRSFIYTTALPPHSLATIQIAYNELISLNGKENRQQLEANISFFKVEVKRLELENSFIESDSAIQCAIITGNEKVKKIGAALENKGYNVKPILSPTVPVNQERLRFCLHSYNSEKQISEVLGLLAKFV